MDPAATAVFCGPDPARLWRAAGGHPDAVWLHVPGALTEGDPADGAPRGAALVHVPAASRDALERAYIDLIAELGRRMPADSWWASPLAEKNEHTSRLFARLLAFHEISRTLEAHPGRRFLVPADDVLCRQLADNALPGWRVRHCRPRGLRDAARAMVAPLVPVARAARHVAADLLGALVARLAFRCARAALRTRHPLYVIRSRLPLTPPGRSPYVDPYFGRLPAFLQRRGYAVAVVARIPGPPWHWLARVRAHPEVTIVPEAAYCTMGDVARSLATAARLPPLAPAPPFAGVRVDRLVAEEYRRGRRALSVYRNRLHFHVARRLAREAHPAAYVQTYENYAWEKMAVAGLRATPGPVPAILGFQHAFVSRNSFKYFIGGAEAPFHPLPDRIVTLGAVTRRLLMRHGDYRGCDLRVGCALRQEQETEPPPTARGVRTVLVPLTMVPEECARLVDYVRRADLAAAGFRVVFRPHPFLPASRIPALRPGRLPWGCEVDGIRPLDGQLAAVDAVAYSWSTVALEAVRAGIPAVHLPVMEPLDVDPLFECPALTWRSATPRDLAGLLESIQQLPDGAYQEQCRAARGYLSEYFVPVTDDTMRAFLPEGA